MKKILVAAAIIGMIPLAACKPTTTNTTVENIAEPDANFGAYDSLNTGIDNAFIEGNVSEPTNTL